MERQWPEYQCHKKVRALQIASVELTPDGWKLSFTDGSFRARVVSGQWFSRHAKEDGANGELEGGYLIEYEDRYLSWSPKAAFESGYTKVDEGP